MKENHQELPLGWAIAKLSDIGEINPSLNCHVEDEMTEVTFVPMRAIDPEGGGLVRPELRSYGSVKRGYTAFRCGDIIMAKITPCMENGKMAVVPEVPGKICFGSTEFHVIRAARGIEPRWIFHYVLQQDTRRAAQRRMTGAVGQMRVPANFFTDLAIPCAH